MLELLLDQSTDLDSEFISFELSLATDILVVCPHDIDESINSEIKKTNAKHASIGALLGMTIDGFDGDDSIIDGAIFGATLGWIFAPNQKEVTASIILCFNDGHRLGLNISRESLTELSTSITNAEKIALGIPARISRPLKEDEKMGILKSRRNTQSAFLAFVISFVFVTFYPFSPAIEVTNTSQLLAELGMINGFPFYMAILYTFALSLAIFFPLRGVIKYQQLNDLSGK